MKTMKLADAKALFPDAPSACHDAMVIKGVCLMCNKTTPRPFYLLSEQPLTDAEAIGVEKRMRPQLPVGAEVVLFVTPHDAGL